MAKVSIIIPIHNSEKYLNECIVSALSQKFREIEILCIDGGSTDSSLNIVNKWMKTDKRIVSIEDPNTSYGHKLNIGIKRAQGKYITILESDDRMLPETVKELYGIAEKFDVDVVDADYYEFFSVKGKEYKNLQRKCYDQVCYNILIDNTIKENKRIAVNGIWTGLYKKSFLLQENIFLNESKGASYQDLSFLFLTSFLAKSVYHLDVPFYQYRIDNVESSVKDDNKIFEIVGECEFLKENLKKRNILDKTVWKRYYVRKYTAFYWNYCRLSLRARELFLNRYLEELRQDEKKGLINRDMFGGDLYNQTYLLLDDINGFINLVSQNEKENIAVLFSNLLDKVVNRDIVIFGAGVLGNRIIDLLKQHDSKIMAICDNSKQLQGKERKGFMIYSVEDAVERFQNAVYIVANRRHMAEMKQQLRCMGIEDEHIVIFYD